MTRTNPFSRLVIRASAGSGKTFQLSARYLTLLLEGAPVDSILATTFTRKAAGEIQDRILARLGEAARSPENAAQLSVQLFDDENAVSQQRLRETAVDVVRSLHRLRICTLDAFFMQIAGGFAFEIGLPPGWRIVEDVDAARLLRQAIQAAFANSQTKNAVQLTRLLFKGDLQRSIEKQISEIANDALDLYYRTQPNAWTQLRKTSQTVSAQDVAQLVVDLENAPLPTTKAGKPNSYYLAARPRLVAAAKNGDWAAFLRETLTQAVADGSRKFARTIFDDELAVPIERLLEFAKQKTVADLAAQTQATWIAANAIANFLQRSKREENAFRFEDVTRILARLEWENRFRQIVYRLDAKTSHLLLDEFQDASLEQWSILKPFAESIVARDSNASKSNVPEERGSFFCVGDVKQAIYGWRGGVAEIFNEIESSIPNVEKAELTVNWRSCPTIIETVNKLFLSIRKNPIFQIDSDADSETPQFRKKRAFAQAAENWNARFSEHRTSPTNASKLGYFALEVAPLVDDSGVLPDFSAPPVDATAQNGSLVPTPDKSSTSESSISESSTSESSTSESSTSDANNELLDVFSDIDPDDESDDSGADGNSGAAKLGEISQKQATLAYSVARIVQIRRQFPNASIGVLTRTNALIVKLIAALKKQGVDASEEGGAPLTDAPSVDAILSALVVASHPGDAVAKFHLANVAPLAERFELTPQNFAEVGTGRRVSLQIRRRVETVGLGRFVAELAETLAPICEIRDRERLEKLVELAFRYQETEKNVRLDRFVQTVRETKIEAPSASTLRVMSLHKSKGLEFDVVVLPELDASLDRFQSKFAVSRKTPTAPIDAVIRSVSLNAQNFLPQQFKKVFEDVWRAAIEEALCLLYVATTRPVRSLIAIISPKKNASYKAPTFANILRAGLAPDALEFPKDNPYYRKAKLIFESGVKNWAINDPPKTQQTPEFSESDAPRFAPIARLALETPNDVNRRLLFHRETPTGSRSSRRWSRPESFALGKALHLCFETISWLDDEGRPNDETLRARLLAFLQNEVDVRRTIRKFDELCATSFVRALLSRSTFDICGALPATFDATRSAVSRTSELVAPVWETFRERSFSRLKNKSSLQRGTIDRLVVLRDAGRIVGAEIVDFKTDRLQTAKDFANSTAKTLAEYRRQLGIYVEVVADWYSLAPEKISARLAFVSEGFALDAASSLENWESLIEKTEEGVPR